MDAKMQLMQDTQAVSQPEAGKSVTITEQGGGYTVTMGGMEQENPMENQAEGGQEAPAMSLDEALAKAREMLAGTEQQAADDGASFQSGFNGVRGGGL